MKAADDFADESAALSAVITPDALESATLFKGWTIADVIRHLHLWNLAALWTLRDPARFRALLATVPGMTSHRQFQADYFADVSAAEVLSAWRASYPEVAAAYASADPDIRLAWAGPPMTAQSSIIARQMETWAHGQAVFDALGLERAATHRLRAVAELGVRTYSWTFRVNDLEPPRPKPFVRLTGPDGVIWTWNEDQPDNRVQGSALGFCQTVTQCRNVADTDIVTTGDTARHWMAIAQCFAGAAEPPPPPGHRHVNSSGSV